VDGRISRAQKVALFLDFDGTLAGFKTKPEDVFLDKGVRRNLARLARSPRFQVSVITGRRRSDIAARVGVSGIHYLGLHGWDDGKGLALSAGAGESLEWAKRGAYDLFLGSPRIWLEDKGASMAVHFRAGEPFPEESRQRLEALLAPRRAWLKLVTARNVFEIVPRELGDKGVAVRRQMAGLSRPVLPIYVGDDWIDEPAFQVLRRGITVHVGRRRKTRARYWVPEVAQVHALLAHFAGRFA
jgi:trehalose 6-phosphate phosphatase